jgi:hypothetical protein
VSIGSVQSNPLSNPWTQLSQSGTGTTSGSATGSDTSVAGQARFGSPLPRGPWSNQGTSVTGGTAANPMQSLASDIQAMLIQAQSTSAMQTAGTTGSSAASGTGAVSPEQQAATDLQTLMNDIQAGASGQSGASAPSSAQTASTTPTDPTGQSEHHHHHHHEEGGAGSGASAVAASSTSSGATMAVESSTNSVDQQVSQVFASDIEQALQAYSGAAAATTMPSLTV